MDVQDLREFAVRHAHEEVRDVDHVEFTLHVTNVAEQEVISTCHLTDRLIETLSLHREDVLQCGAETGILNRTSHHKLI